MTALTIPAPPATGRSFIQSPSTGREAGHTVVVHGRVDDPFMGRALLDFDLAFSTATRVVSRPDLTPLVEGIVTSDVAAHEEAARSVVDTIERISTVLRLPIKDILTAAKIRKRTYHYWKNHPGARPRLDSMGDVWSLAQSVELLEERPGLNLPEWIAQPRHRDLLRRGDHDRLVQLATTPHHLDEEMLGRESRRAVGFGESDETCPHVVSNVPERLAPTRARTAKRGRPRGAGPS